MLREKNQELSSSWQTGQMQEGNINEDNALRGR